MVIVWAVPCGLFVSLTANDQVLPGVLGAPKQSTGLENTSSKKKSVFKNAVEYLTDQWQVVFGSFGGIFNAFKILADKRK